jgi:ubiquitin-conjugating enzyme E2 T
MAMKVRIQKEVSRLTNDPPPGCWCAPKGDNICTLEAQIEGRTGTVYERGVWTLSIDIPPRYPFEPPKVRFLTKIYHPNIDSEGRICLDILNMPGTKGGAWKPSLSVFTILQSVALLMSEPNPEDGLVTDVTHEYRHHRELFDMKAKQWTRKYATKDTLGGGSSKEEEEEEEEGQKQQKQPLEESSSQHNNSQQQDEQEEPPPPTKKSKLADDITP